LADKENLLILIIDLYSLSIITDSTVISDILDYSLIGIVFSELIMWCLFCTESCA